MPSAENFKIAPSSLKFPQSSYQPLKSLHILFTVLSLVVLIPYWGIYYSFTKKPRVSWKIGECIAIRAMRWMMPLNAECGLAPLSVSKVNPPSDFKESSLVWLEPADKSLVVGIAKDEKILPVRVPGYVWPKGQGLDDDISSGFVGLFIHGGGYMMGNGMESFGELEIVRSLLKKNSEINHVLSVEYRLVGEGSHPAQLLDALAAYAHLVKMLKIDPTRIIFLGACSGGNLVMMLSRYLYEEKVLPLPGGLMLFSPVLDMVKDFEILQGSAPPRPNTDIDWLEASHYANLRFLGHNSLDLLKSPYFSSNRAPVGSYTGYPPIFVSVGDAESLQKENEQLVELMRNDGVDVVLNVQKDAVHDFIAVSKLMPSEAARREAMNKACEWIGSSKTQRGV
ncbi:alpha/beta-hydrolase [Marasmius fiardii PR-910]|nr:alpha/beta-hydrolase [Marasmius fiardii PR-910]